jgi:phosphonate transport system substrate-binding protein
MRFITSILFLFLFSCIQKQTSSDDKPIYEKSVAETKPLLRFAIHPLHNPERLLKVFGPLIDHLNRNIPEVNFQLEASINYSAFEEKLKKRELAFALPNSYQTINSLQYGYHIFAKMGDDYNFRGLILTRKDSGIKKFAQLKGKTISYPAATALAATMLPQYFLLKNGLNVIKETKTLYAGSQESSIMNVFLGTSVAGCTWPPPWKAFIQNNPDKAQQLEVKWETSSLPNNGLVVRDDISKIVVNKVQVLLLNLHNTTEGKAILDNIGLSKFETADEATYKSVKSFIGQFTKELRAPDQEK